MSNLHSPSTLPPFRLRRASYSDLPSLSLVSTSAFWDDVLFGRVIHPQRDKYPDDPPLYWLRRAQVDWWDWSHVYMISTVDEGGKEIITGAATWCRMSTRIDNWKAGWGLRWWDPRNVLVPLARFFVSIKSFFQPNRAASPTDEDIIERSYNYLDHIWTGPIRSKSWYLENLAVHPKYQGQGHGRALVKWGLDQAQKEGISASVISADGKEKFYQLCGFDIGPVGRSGEGEGNPLDKVPGGLIFFWQPKG